MSSFIDYRALRIPDELTVTPTQPKRVLIVGSCLSESWALRMKLLPRPCESDVYLLGRTLPETPERPIGDYDFQLVQLALRFILPDASFARLAETDVEGHKRLFDHAAAGMKRFLGDAMRWNREHGLLTFVFPFVTPLQNAAGRLLPRYDLRNPVYFVERLNEALVQELAGFDNTYFFDLNEIHDFFGRRFVQEDYYSALNHGGYLGNFDFDHDGNRLEPARKATDFFEDRVFEIFLASWRELMALYKTIRQTDAVKLVVIDLDDTLWRGVIAETDVDAMPTTEGWPKGFWEALLFLKRRGILLALVSKNEESRVVGAWDKILVRQLGLDDFATRRINWRPKPDNMAEILAEMNLLPRNVVFIDDNPAERAAMKAAYPGIRVLGGAPLTWRRILLWAPETQVAGVTAESAMRTDMAQAQVRREAERQTMPREEFLASLAVTMTHFTIGAVDHPRFDRAFELLNKTNQFNTTGRRWTREECTTAFAAGTVIHAFQAADRFTDYGLVVVAIVEARGIAQFVMSCRVMGLDVERAALSIIGERLRAGGAHEVFAAMVETDRNQPCRDLYASVGFRAAPGGWRRALTPWFAPPGHVAIAQATPAGRLAVAD